MSKVIATGAILGSHYYVKQAEALVEKAITEKGADFKFEFPDTAYFLPQMFSMTGFEVRTLGDMKTALEQQVKPLLTEAPADQPVQALSGRGAGRRHGGALCPGNDHGGPVHLRTGAGEGRLHRPDLQRVHLRHHPPEPRRAAGGRLHAGLRLHHRRGGQRRPGLRDRPRTFSRRTSSRSCAAT